MNKPKVKSRKKYAIGGTVTPHITPAEQVFNDTRMAEESAIEASQNEWVQGLNAFGGMLTQVGSQMIASGVSGYLSESNPTSGAGKFMKNNASGIGDMAGSVSQMITTGRRRKYKNGSKGVNNNQIEVEGKEVLENPNTGELAKVKGPSHEQGGVDVNVPDGTVIYSDRVKKMGESMAQRKISRENKKARLEKLLEKNKFDIATRNAYNRTMSILDKEEKQDLDTQELINYIEENNNRQQYSTGTSSKGVRKRPKDLSFSTDIDTPKDYSFSTDIDGQILSPVKKDDVSFAKQVTDYQEPGIYELDKKYTDEANEKAGLDMDFNLGDAISITGDLYSTFEPMRNTMRNRKGDTPNINAFKNYGQKSLETINSEKGLLENQKNNALVRNLDVARTSRQRNANSSRSINTIRAMNAVTDSQLMDSDNSVSDSYANSLLGILDKQANMEANIDKIVMQGEQNRDLDDRKDRDNFYSQLAIDIATKGQGIQQTGKDVNTMKKNKMTMKMLNQLSKYGLGFDSKGNIIQLPTK